MIPNARARELVNTTIILVVVYRDSIEQKCLALLDQLARDAKINKPLTITKSKKAKVLLRLCIEFLECSIQVMHLPECSRLGQIDKLLLYQSVHVLNKL